jgi:type II secretory pathway component PulF
MNESLGPFNLILLALPGLGLKIAVRIMYGRRPPVAWDPLQLLLSLSGTILLMLAGLGAMIGLVGFWWMLIPVPIVVGVVVFTTIDRQRHGEHRALVWCLAAAAERGIPLSEAARAYADEALGDTGSRALALAQSLEQGVSLAEAVRVARLRLSTAMKMSIRTGEALGLLGPAMRQQLDDSGEGDAALRGTIARFFYLGIVTIFASGLLTFMMIKIVPVMQKMFEEFGLQLPRITVLVISLSNWFVSGGFLLAIPLFLAALVFMLAAVVYFLGWVPRDLPLIWRLFRRYDGALVMRSLALVVRRKGSIVDGLRLIGSVYPIRQVGYRVDQAVLQTMHGADWIAALQQQRLISSVDAAVLASAQRAGNLVWALEEMADSAIRRETYRLQVLVQVLFPPAVITLGVFVGMFCLAIMLPLIALIQGLS